ncbi:hypothetical protein LNK20_18695 [Bacillus safensis]|uniref:hypothetical protein n=1 Tax=Bacillus safensis TaxID=561879 RepID=UPI001FF9296B|nr:hypothetical protein [Bacillus safensis]MCK1974721.1 hypothetical protein [Bacillus safensis]
MAVIFLLYASIVIAGLLSIIKNSDIFNYLFKIISILLESIFSISEYLQGNSSDVIIITSLPYLNFDLFTEFKILIYAIFTVSLIFFLKFISDLFSLKRMTHLILSMLFQVTLSFIFFSETIPVILLVAVIMTILFYFIPLGSGRYFSLIEYGSFLESAYKPVSLNFNIYKFILRAILPMAPFALFFKILIPQVTVYLVILIYIAILLFIFMNTYKDKFEGNLRKIVVFSLIIIITISQQKFEGNVIGFILSILAIFFSFERLLSAFKDLKKEIQDNSLLYIIEKKRDDLDWLVENKLNFSIQRNGDFSESLLLKQIIIHFYLDEKDDLLILTKKYSESYGSNIRFVEQIKYFALYSTKNIKEKYKYLSRIFEMEKSEVELQQIYIEYSWVIFYETEEYDKIIQLLNEISYILSDEDKFILYYSLMRTGKEKYAQNLKNEINNFEQIEHEINMKKQFFLEKSSDLI